MWNRHLTDAGSILRAQVDGVRNPDLLMLPVLDVDDLVRLATDEDTQTMKKELRRNKRKHTIAAVRRMQKDGNLVVTEAVDGRVRLEPPDWWGRGL